MIKIPENLKKALRSSKGDNKLSRSVKGGLGTLVFFVAYTTSLTESDALLAVNAILLLLSAAYGAFGVFAKIYNKYHNDKI